MIYALEKADGPHAAGTLVAAMGTPAPPDVTMLSRGRIAAWQAAHYLRAAVSQPGRWKDLKRHRRAFVVDTDGRAFWARIVRVGRKEVELEWEGDRFTVEHLSDLLVEIVDGEDEEDSEPERSSTRKLEETTHDEQEESAP